MQGLDLIIFDCDGVLVDSEIVAARVEARLLSAAGFDITPEEIAERYAGLNFQDILLRIESETGTPFQASLIDKAEKMVDERLDKEVKAVDGALAAIDAVGTRTCICSNSSSDRLPVKHGRIYNMRFDVVHIYCFLDFPGLRSIGNIAIGKQHNRRNMLQSDFRRSICHGKAIGRRLGRNHYHRAFAISTIKSLHQIRLFGFCWQTS